MRKKIFGVAMVTTLLVFTISGCQKAPESSTNNEILHAKDSVGEEVADLVEMTGTEAGIDRDMKDINCFIGTEENGIRIDAPAPYVPDNVYHMVLKENSALNMELLEDFLESDSGKISDLSEEQRKEVEQVEAANKKSEEKAMTSTFGGESLYVVSDGEKEASFTWGTSAYYKDQELYNKCASIYKTATEKEFDETNIAAALSENFSIKEAKTLLMDKLHPLQITEVHVYEAYMYESENFAFYEIQFTPSYEGMGVVHSFGSVAYGENFPEGRAWVCSDGVAEVSLTASLGETVRKDKYEEVLSWEQIENILELYLNSGKIQGSSKCVMSKVEFAYYPLLSEDESELELIPVWHIYIPLSAWVEDEELAEEIGMNGVSWNICVNAVSGEIVRVR